MSFYCALLPNSFHLPRVTFSIPHYPNSGMLMIDFLGTLLLIYIEVPSMIAFLFPKLPLAKFSRELQASFGYEMFKNLSSPPFSARIERLDGATTVQRLIVSSQPLPEPAFQSPPKNNQPLALLAVLITPPARSEGRTSVSSSAASIPFLPPSI